MGWLLLVLAVVLALFFLTVLRGAPYVPSRRADLQIAFKKLYKIDEKDFLIDIGSGDGVVLRHASRMGAKALGFEINPILALVSKWLSRHDDKVEVRLADFWFTKFPKQTTIVYVFGESRDINRMFEKVQSESNRLQKQIWFLSYGFRVPNAAIEKQAGAHVLYKISPLQAELA